MTALAIVRVSAATGHALLDTVSAGISVTQQGINIVIIRCVAKIYKKNLQVIFYSLFCPSFTLDNNPTKNISC